MALAMRFFFFAWLFDGFCILFEVGDTAVYAMGIEGRAKLSRERKTLM